MKYIAVLKQEADGCDYTIGCGNTTVQFEAETSVEAANKLKEIIKANYNHDETRLKSLNYYAVSASYEVKLDQWYGQFNAEKKKEQESATTAKELEELYRLKKKYNL